MNNDQIDLFEIIQDRLVLNTDICLIEFCGGVGSQSMALQELGYNIVQHKLYDIDYEATCSNALIHHDLESYMVDEFDLEQDFMIEELSKYYFTKNDKPINLKRLSLEKLKLLYYAQKLTNNETDIFNIDIDVLEEWRDKFESIHG